jgi:hypothetical protein
MRKGRYKAPTVSAPIPWYCLKGLQPAAGSGLRPSIPAFRWVLDYSQHAGCSTVPM